MSDVIRLDVINTCGGHCYDVVESSKGEYVTYADYRNLEEVYHLLISKLAELNRDFQ